MSDVPEHIVVTDEPVKLPVAELLTGRGFISGKSGSGKSNTASVIAEEFLEAGLPLLIVDTDGEYYGLQERYQILHATADEGGDMTVEPDDAERLAGLALDGNVPVILDVSAHVDLGEAQELIERVLREIFRMEDSRRKPFLLIIEEIHEYLPEQGAHGQLGDLLIRIAKRGRKRGLGLCGISQRPAAVDKDFITQCDWLVWHRLTWQNDTRVVKQLLGSEAADTIQDLEDGEAFLMTDWDDTVQRVHFRKKRTLDAGATPNLAEVAGGPDASLDDEVLQALSMDEGAVRASAEDPPGPKDRRIRQLKAQIAELEEELDRARYASPPDSPPSTESGGPIAQGLTELGSLAAHTVRTTSYRIKGLIRTVSRRLGLGES